METNQRGESAPTWGRRMETKAVQRGEGRNFSSYTEPRGPSCTQPQPTGHRLGPWGSAAPGGPSAGGCELQGCGQHPSFKGSDGIVGAQAVGHGVLRHRGAPRAWRSLPHPIHVSLPLATSRALCNGRQ